MVINKSQFPSFLSCFSDSSGTIRCNEWMLQEGMFHCHVRTHILAIRAMPQYGGLPWGEGKGTRGDNELPIIRNIQAGLGTGHNG